MRYIKQNKGFTLVELVVALSLMGMVMSSIFTFFMVNYKTFFRANNQTDAQYNAQIAMDEMVDYIVRAEKIESINPIISTNIETDINDIIFKLNDNEYFEVQYNDSTKKLFRGIDTNITTITTNEYANNITKFEVKLLGDSTFSSDYRECKGIRIMIESIVDGQTVKIENEVYFRNWNE